jgi:hypothetical protein
MATGASDKIVALSTLQLRNQSFELLVHSVQNKKILPWKDFFVQNKKIYLESFFSTARHTSVAARE